MVKGRPVRRGEVYLVSFDPTRGSEIRKTRPALVISPDDINDDLRTVIVAPMTSKGQEAFFRVGCRFRSKTGRVVLDQIRTVDKERLVRRLGALPAPTVRRVLEVLREMFAA